MSKYEVTMAQWRAVARMPKVYMDLKPDLSPQYEDLLKMGIADLLDPSEFARSKAEWMRKFGGDNNPAITISWEEAIEAGAKPGRALWGPGKIK